LHETWPEADHFDLQKTTYSKSFELFCITREKERGQIAWMTPVTFQNAPLSTKAAGQNMHVFADCCNYAAVTSSQRSQSGRNFKLKLENVQWLVCLKK